MGTDSPVPDLRFRHDKDRGESHSFGLFSSVSGGTIVSGSDLRFRHDID